MAENRGSSAPPLAGNHPKGEEFMVNTRDEVMHVRTFVPADPQDIKALVYFQHGYGGHNSADGKVRLGNAMPPVGIAMAMLDLPGHGYSEGERAYIEKYSHWIDDMFQFMEAIAGGGFKSSSEGKFALSKGQLERLKTVPIFIAGESLGGGLALYVGLTLYDRQHTLLPRFKGVCLTAPAIQGNPPPKPLVFLLRYLVAPLIPRRQIPNVLESVKNPMKVWKTELARGIAEQDEWGKPGGLSWGHNMKWKMGMNMMDMVEVVYTRLADVKFPFLVMHDPEDAIVQFAPVLELMEKAATPNDDPRARELKRMDGMLHDIITNCPELAIGYITDWGEEFMVNTRDEVLHLRTFVPEDPQDIKALVYFQHGYGGHLSAKVKMRLGNSMPPAGIAMAMLDLPGHGYSEGERAYIDKYSHWIDDMFQFMEAIAGGGFKSSSEGKFALSKGQLERLKTVPIFIAGESLGGGLALYVGLTLYDRQGVCVSAPAIQGSPPPRPLVLLLRYLIAPLIPRRQIPNVLEAGALGWGHNMKWNMGLNMMDMIDVVYNRLADVKFPFLVMQDPEDAIVQFAPVLELMEKAATPNDDPRARELKRMDGMLHDIITNCPELAIGYITDWVLYQTERA
eukprot:g8628.t1